MGIAQFDREMGLGELLAAAPLLKLRAALTAMLGEHWGLRDAAGQLLLGVGESAGDDPMALPLYLEIELIGKLAASGARREQLMAAVAWLGIVLADAYRYRMVSDLHKEAVHADYEALQRKHQALQESESRYRELAAQLEQRVEQQVQTISRAQRQLYQAEKLASVGSLAAGMAHEINNPVGFIRSNINTGLGYVRQMSAALLAFRQGQAQQAGQLWQQADLDFVLEDFPGLLAESMHGADRVTRIVANLRTYANIDYAESAPVDLNDAVRTVAGIVADQMREEIKLEMELQALPKIECDQGRIHQMLLSILQNAVLAIAGPGLVRITTEVAAAAASAADAADGGAEQEIRIAISDSGCGIPPEALERIFDPFYTQRDVGKGTGLGLTVSHDIAASHGGRITVHSTVGTGSRFTVHLPVQPVLSEPGSAPGSAPA
ncbi:MAG: ATP-binding protein [Pseudomonadota bacterium]